MADTHALALRPFIVQSMQELSAQPDNVSALHDPKRNVDSLTKIGFSAAVVYDKMVIYCPEAGRFSENKPNQYH
ncbi:MAG: hypothetical protein IPP22_09495 [Nitrosomonas sp.]|nr:hypothetical protein [Nitrosomonas sp.]